MLVKKIYNIKETKEMRNELVGKKCKLVKRDGFMLYGTVSSQDEFGVFFRTDQKVSFIAWYNIKELTPQE